MSLVIIESQHFTDSSTQNNKILHISKTENTKSKTIDEKFDDEKNKYEYIDKNIEEKTEKNKDIEKNDISSNSDLEPKKSEEINDLIKDLESVYAKKTPKSVNLDQDLSNSPPNANDDKKIYSIKFNSFVDKDDAVLELNRLRLQHKDLVSKMETSVKPYKSGDKKYFGIFGKVKNGDKKTSQDLCDKFESRGIECVLM
ncbi:hypothetical protein [Candidatus Deianiraea vastatrix]|nr:hypothetical protein [Candidatus Deianiraea vastatrix]